MGINYREFRWLLDGLGIPNVGRFAANILKQNFPDLPAVATASFD